MRYKTAESVTLGHPDKLCDYIADSILDEALKQDRNARVAIEVMIAHDSLFMGGEITAEADLDYTKIAHEAIRFIGYDHVPAMTYKDIDEQSWDICQAIDKGNGEVGAGDQGIVYGYATSETLSGIPLPLEIARIITDGMTHGCIPYGPDGKSQVTVTYGENGSFDHIDTILASIQHPAGETTDRVRGNMERAIRGWLAEWDLTQTKFIINPSGQFIEGGFKADTGLTGRKIMVDSYGGLARHGGGAFSGKDPSKMDRAGAYMARYAALQVVGAGLAEECEIAVAYAIGKPEPLAVDVETFGTAHFPAAVVAEVVKAIFDFSPAGIEKTLHLRDWPHYKITAAAGHFGGSQIHDDKLCIPPWEVNDVDAMKRLRRRARELADKYP